MVGSKALKKSRSDPAVKKALQRLAGAVGAAAANVLITTGAEVVAVGGGVVQELRKWLWPDILEAVKNHSFAPEHHVPRVQMARLGDDTVAVGTAMYARTKLQN